MTYYKKLGISKEEWLRKWRKELLHRNWTPLKTIEDFNNQLELFEKGVKNEQKKTMDEDC